MYATLPELETLSKQELVDAEGTTYREFRVGLKPRFALVWLKILGAWLLLIGVLWTLSWFDGRVFGTLGDWVVSVALGGLAIGYLVAYLHLFIHEAAHWNLAKNRAKNDLLANVFLGAFLGLDVRTYRPIHWAHHKYIGTPRDTEHSYFEALSARFLFESLTGLRVLRVIAARGKALQPDPEAETQDAVVETGGAEALDRSNRTAPRSRHQPWTALGLNVALLAGLAALGWWNVALAWCVGLGVVFPFLASVRQVIEHRDPAALADADFHVLDHGAVNHLFGSGPIASTLGGAGFNRHLLHHLDPQVSCTRLKDLEGFFMQTSIAPVLDAHRTTYGAQFVRLLRAARRRGSA